jgi:UDP-glucuronate 4-epimerase
MKILVTGSAGFIGFHLAQYLVNRGDEVVGIDNLNDYYDVNLKFGRLAESGISAQSIDYNQQLISENNANYKFVKLDLMDKNNLEILFRDEQFDGVCNLAAQAGVRYSLINPQAYIDSNIQGFMNLLECSRNNKIKHLVYASSSSVYGLNQQMPFSVRHNADHPVSLYAASKKSNEVMAHSYSHLFNIPTTGLRFFTVYGPWGRPDMALFLFTKAIIEGKPIQIFNNGNMMRDFTYIDDVVEGVVKVLDNPPVGDHNWDAVSHNPSNSSAPYQLFNIGKGNPVNLLDFINQIEENLGIKAIREYLPMQDGDVAQTWSDIEDLDRKVNFKPNFSVANGVKNFVDWYRDFYNVKIKS